MKREKKCVINTYKRELIKNELFKRASNQLFVCVRAAQFLQNSSFSAIDSSFSFQKPFDNLLTEKKPAGFVFSKMSLPLCSQFSAMHICYEVPR